MRKLYNLVKLSAVITIILSIGATSVCAAEYDKADIPEPIKVIDFSKSFEELSAEDAGFEVVENEASPVLVNDEEMGQVLQLKEGVIKNIEYKDGEDWGAIVSDDSHYSTIKLTNPYVGMEHLVEYEPYEEVETAEYTRVDDGNTKTAIQPLWEEGITISYWIKTPVGDDGLGVNSNVVGFTAERLQMRSDDYNRHLRTVLFDMEYEALTDEERSLYGPEVERCGVLPDSKFYFELAEEETYEGLPLYKDPDGESMGAMFHYNKFYVPGYFKLNDGSIVSSAEWPYNFADKDYYNLYKELPRLGLTKDDHDPGNSLIRYGWSFGEMWLDASSSFSFYNEHLYDEQLNPNCETESSTGDLIRKSNSYEIESYVKSDGETVLADSPISYPDEWHNVVVVIQNDWVQYYLDGEEINIIENYSWGGIAFDELHSSSLMPWRYFNKGTGPRGGYLSNGVISAFERDVTMGYSSITIMEWLTMECTNLTIGGGDRYASTEHTDEIELKNVVFYDKMLDAEQIKYLAENPFIYDSKYGDVNSDGVIDAEDALAVLKYAAKLETLYTYQEARANVDDNDMVNANDALEILKYSAGIIEKI